MPSAKPDGSPIDMVDHAAKHLPDVTTGLRYDGARVWKARGCFMAAIASHPEAEPASLVVRVSGDERQWLLDEAGDIYYVTESYRPHPVVLVRLTRIDTDTLRDVLRTSWRLAIAKAPARRRRGNIRRRAKNPGSRRGIPVPRPDTNGG